MDIQKIFCIGFHKTGTKSLGRALELLDYKVCGPIGAKDPRIGQNVYRIVDSLIDQYDAFQDNPWPLVFRYADKKVPGSKFILTLRSETDWIKSVVDHFGSTDTPMRTWMYGEGHPLGNEQRYISRYGEHNEQVVSYFQYRQDDLLTMELDGDFGWEKLCKFLKKPLPQIKFPHLNPRNNRIDGSA